MPIRYLKHRISSNNFLATLLIGFCLFQATNLYAAEYEYLVEATARVEQIDNPRRSNSSGQDEFLSEQRLRGTLSRATSKLVTNIDYQGSKYNYRENLLTDRSFITGASSINWIISPERLSWNLSNTRSLQIVDSLQPDTLDNRQVISLTSTGPSVTFQLSGRNKLSGSVDYSIADYEKSGLSGQNRTTADLLFSHNFSTSYISSIGGNYLQSSFDNAPTLDFDRYEYFWQNEYTTESFNLNLMLGQNVLMRDGFEDQENVLIRLTGNYKVNSQSTLDFDYSDSYEDIFSNMLRGPITPITPTTTPPLIGDRLGNSNLNQNYELVRKGIGYAYTRSEFFGADFRYSESKRTYQGLETDLNQSDKVYSVGTNWNLFQNLNLNIYGRYTEQEFTDINREQERKEYGLQARYRISQSLYTQFTVFNVDQSGTLPLDNYDGLNYALSLTLAIGNQ